jgi:hypothetical protein
MLYTKKQFAELTNKSTRELSVYISRVKVIVVNDLIDPSNDTNKAFLMKFGGEKTLKTPPKPQKQVDEDFGEDFPETDDSPDESGINPLQISDKRYKHFLAQKTERAAELDRIRIEKVKGILVPSAPIIPIFLRHNQYIMQEQKNADEEILSSFAHKYDITSEDVAHFRGEQVKRRNAAATRAAEMSVKNIENTINGYSEKKRVS